MDGLSIELQGLILSKVVSSFFYIKYLMHFTGLASEMLLSLI